MSFLAIYIRELENRELQLSLSRNKPDIFRRCPVVRGRSCLAKFLTFYFVEHGAPVTV